MNAAELRIGNIVERKFLLNDNWVQITVDANDICACVVNSDAFQPIPLTDEWLVKMGFSSGFSDEQFVIKVTKNCLMSVWIYHGNNCMIGDELEFSVEYVHQLQNLYFSLTEQELTITP